MVLAACAAVLAPGGLLAPLAAARGQAGERAPGPGRPQAAAGPGLERWRQLPPEKRQAVARIHRRLAELPARERQGLLRRLRSMSPGERRIALQHAGLRLAQEDPVERAARRMHAALVRERIQRLPPGERERLRRLPPEERRRFLEERSRENRLRIIGRLPDPVRELVATLPAREQAAAIRRFRAEETFRRTFREPAELRWLRSQPPAKRRDLLLPSVEAQAPPPPRPEAISARTWTRWTRLKPFERLRVLRRLDELLAAGTGG
jgi:hypothetical protein